MKYHSTLQLGMIHDVHAGTTHNSQRKCKSNNINANRCEASGKRSSYYLRSIFTCSPKRLNRDFLVKLSSADLAFGYNIILPFPRRISRSISNWSRGGSSDWVVPARVSLANLSDDKINLHGNQFLGNQFLWLRQQIPVQ